MGLISTEVEVSLDGGCIKYYESLGYVIPRTEKVYRNKKGNIKDRRMTVSKGTKIKVKVSDLPPKSTVLVEIECDYCHKHKMTRYSNYYECNHDGKYYCRGCNFKVFCSGSKNHNWNPNLTDEERNDRRKPKNIEHLLNPSSLVIIILVNVVSKKINGLYLYTI